VRCRWGGCSRAGVQCSSVQTEASVDLTGEPILGILPHRLPEVFSAGVLHMEYRYLQVLVPAAPPVQFISSGPCTRAGQ
jgi:hypothetical protein